MSAPRRSRSLQVLLDQVDARWPYRDKSSDGWIGDAAHRARVSEHNPDLDGTVDAQDITHDPASGCDISKITEAIRASRDRRVQRMIFNGRICSGSRERSPWVWRRYTGSHPHHTHLHIEVEDEFQDDTNPWSIGDNGASEPLFERKAPGIMRELIPALTIDELDAAAILGNLGHESDGFRAHQEYGHTGSSGGIGWAQWTEVRRRAFERWCRENGLDTRSDDGNLGFLIHELTNTSEKRVLPIMRSVDGLRAKTIKFCDVFERPGVKAYEKRVAYAERALAAYEAQQLDPEPDPPPDDGNGLPTPYDPSDGGLSPDTLLDQVRPRTITVRDRITSQIEGFPDGFVETIYERQSCRFVQGGLSEPQPDERPAISGPNEERKEFGVFNPILTMLAERLLSRLFGKTDWKSETGIWSLIAGVILYMLQQNGINPLPIEGTDTQPIVDFVQNILFGAGGFLTTFGLGQKTPKA